MDGQKVAYFSDEWSCKAQINKIKMQLENAMSNLVKELPREIQREYGNQFRSEMKSNINRMNFTYRKEAKTGHGIASLRQTLEQSIKILKMHLRMMSTNW